MANDSASSFSYSYYSSSSSSPPSSPFIPDTDSQERRYECHSQSAPGNVVTGKVDHTRGHVHQRLQTWTQFEKLETSLRTLAVDSRVVEKRLSDLQEIAGKTDLPFTVNQDFPLVYGGLMRRSHAIAGEIKSSVSHFRNVALSDIENNQIPLAAKYDSTQRWIQWVQPRLESSHILPRQFKQLARDLSAFGGHLRTFFEDQKKLLQFELETVNNTERQLDEQVRDIEDAGVCGCVGFRFGSGSGSKAKEDHSAATPDMSAYPSVIMLSDALNESSKGKATMSSSHIFRSSRKARQDLLRRREEIHAKEQKLAIQREANAKLIEYIDQTVPHIESLGRRMRVFWELYDQFSKQIAVIAVVLRENQSIPHQLTSWQAALDELARVAGTYNLEIQ
ncbi:hypothetical protein K474DRAFT_1673128 [Panus rudis PR-1116 ss-1]|nr:hypothetical protein K474DRAFT_1673128 [Panus rudis PR-1116 ss-1]